MASQIHSVSIGIDFGTSNTVLALAAGDGRVETIRFEHGGRTHGVFASAMCFWQEKTGTALPPRVDGGPWAVERFLAGSTALRFIQSFKTYAASGSFQSTIIFRQRFHFEDLLAAFLRSLMRRAGTGLDLAAARVSIGRPVQFSGTKPDDALAMRRYRAAFDRIGIQNARFVYEPVGAAFSLTRDLERDAIVLVADFGGGTSDFSVMKFSRNGGVLRAEPLGHAGVGVAGDTFDSRIVDRVVAPRLGKGGSYRSFGKTLPLPTHFYGTLGRWNELALMRGSDDLRALRELERSALDPEPLRDFILLIEQELGFPLYQAVSAAKVALSEQTSVDFQFINDAIDIRATIARQNFESWISDDLARIEATVDQVLTSSGIKPDDIEKVFLTGGTSFVPAVQRLFADRFGRDKLSSANQFESIAQGLALIGQSDRPDQWAVAA